MFFTHQDNGDRRMHQKVRFVVLNLTWWCILCSQWRSSVESACWACWSASHASMHRLAPEERWHDVTTIHPRVFLFICFRFFYICFFDLAMRQDPLPRVEIEIRRVPGERFRPPSKSMHERTCQCCSHLHNASKWQPVPKWISPNQSDIVVGIPPVDQSVGKHQLIRAAAIPCDCLQDLGRCHGCCNVLQWQRLAGCFHMSWLKPVWSQKIYSKCPVMEKDRRTACTLCGCIWFPAF